MKTSDLRRFNECLEVWFATNAREFIFRRPPFDPYLIWVSEIMSQQTQIERVAETFLPRFLQKFPDLGSLAGADWEEVFPVWKGLGFYARGKNMILAAQILEQKHGGVFPQNLGDLQNLPGVGSYTAAAILAFGFDQKVAALDTNISKIIAGIFPDQNPEEVAEKLVQLSWSGRSWNGAMMDLASFLRLGKEIEGSISEFFPKNLAQSFRPKRSGPTSRAKNTGIEVGVACIWEDGKYLIQSRPGKVGSEFWEFPGGKRQKGETIRGCVQREIGEELGVEVSVRPHFYEEVVEFVGEKYHLKFHRCQIQTGTPRPLELQEIDWVRPQDFGRVNFLPSNKKVLGILGKMRV